MIIEIIKIIAFVVAAMVVFTYVKQYIFKLKVNKWIVLALCLIFFGINFYVEQNYKGILSYVVLFIVCILMLWFLELNNVGKNPKFSQNKEKNKNQMVIKTKAKPNRIKNLS